VNIGDLATVALAYHSQPGDPNWNPNCDVNDDSQVTIADLAYIAFYYHSPAFTA